MSVTDLVNPDGGRWWEKFNPDIADGIEQIENELDDIDSELRKGIEHPIFNTERNLSKLDTRLTKPLATGLNKTISVLNTLYTDTQNNIEGRIATIDSALPKLSQSIPIASEFLGEVDATTYILPPGKCIYRWNTPTGTFTEPYWTNNGCNCPENYFPPNPTHVPMQGEGYYLFSCISTTSPPTPPPSEPPSEPPETTCLGFYPPPVPVPVPNPFPFNSCIWRWYGLPQGWFNEHCQCDTYHRANEPQRDGVTIGETCITNCVSVNEPPTPEPPPYEPPTSEPPLPPLPPVNPPVLPPNGSPCPPPIINVSCPPPHITITNPTPVVNITVSCPPNGKPDDEQPPEKEPPISPKEEEPKEPGEPPITPPTLPPPLPPEEVMDCDELDKIAIKHPYCEIDQFEKLVVAIEKSLGLKTLDRTLLTSGMSLDTTRQKSDKEYTEGEY